MEDNELNDEDKKAWQEFTGESVNGSTEKEDFEALLDASRDDFEDKKLPKSSSEPVKHKPLLKTHTPQLDKRTDEKLRKGKMPIEARLDLHGMRQNVAHERLEQFIQESANKGLRMVLVITGKGKSKSTSEDWLTPSQGVLKTNVPEWLNGATMRSYILKIYPAQPKDGGSGALYVYLKRRR